MEKLHKRKKTSVGDTIFVICNTLFMILFVLITLYPILNTVAISLNDIEGWDLSVAPKIYLEELSYRFTER